MNNINSKKDIHGTKLITRWVHKHRILGKWLVKSVIAGITIFSYYLKKQEKKIEEEERERG